MQAERVLRVDCEPRSLVAIDSAKKHLVSTQPDGKITRWSLRKGHSDQLRGHMRRATCLAFSPRSDLLCTGSLDHSLRLFNMDGGECIGVLEGHEDEVTCAAFDSQGRLVCSGSADKSLKLWRVMDGRSIRAYKGTENPVIWLECAPRSSDAFESRRQGIAPPPTGAGNA